MKNLKKLVIEEATKLKEFATKEEINRLNAEMFFPTLPNRCIYGLMTGDCYSERATELLNLCTNPYSAGVFHLDKSRCLWFSNLDKGRNAHSPIEYYIAQHREGSNLIAFLKGEIETLTPEML